MSERAESERYPHIVRSPATAGGQPVVQGTRIAVTTLVRAHQAGMDFDEILVQYPGLSAAGLHAALLYYLDHSGEINALLEAAERPPDGATIVEV